MSDLLQRYSEWLNGELEQTTAYHNHKETMAWTATALFLAAVGALLAAPPDAVVAKPGLSRLVIVVVAVLVVVFWRMQFSMRWHAADTCVALRRALARVNLASVGVGSLAAKDFEATSDWVLAGLPECVAQEARVVRQQLNVAGFRGVGKSSATLGGIRRWPAIS